MFQGLKSEKPVVRNHHWETKGIYQNAFIPPTAFAIAKPIQIFLILFSQLIITSSIIAHSFIS